MVCLSDEGGSTGTGIVRTEILEGSLHKRCPLLRISLKPKWETQLESAVLQSIYSAKKEYRLRIGLYHSLKILEFEPSIVTLCILPVFDSRRDSMCHMQMLLVNAYCNENSIRILKVRSPENLLTIARHSTETDTEGEGGFEDCLDEEDDDSIILILASQHPNIHDESLKTAFDAANLQTDRHPIITLPGC